MNGFIVRRSKRKFSTIALDEKSRDQMAHLGAVAALLLEEQDYKMWAEAASPGFLNFVIEGARVMRQLGSRNEEREVVIDDWVAHMAFITCSFLSLFVSRLNAGEKEALGVTIEVISACCPVNIRLHGMPNLGSLPDKYQASPAIRSQHEQLLAAFRKPEQEDLTLRDAFNLLQLYELAGESVPEATVRKLRNVTEGLRTALARIQQKPDAD